jgi:hypothetical protein
MGGSWVLCIFRILKWLGPTFTVPSVHPIFIRFGLLGFKILVLLLPELIRHLPGKFTEPFFRSAFSLDQ